MARPPRTARLLAAGSSPTPHADSFVTVLAEGEAITRLAFSASTYFTDSRPRQDYIAACCIRTLLGEAPIDLLEFCFKLCNYFVSACLCNISTFAINGRELPQH